jgi:hypothetical protein
MTPLMPAQSPGQEVEKSHFKTPRKRGFKI